jgi:hypothetical protein
MYRSTNGLPPLMSVHNFLKDGVHRYTCVTDTTGGGVEQHSKHTEPTLSLHIANDQTEHDVTYHRVLILSQCTTFAHVASSIAMFIGVLNKIRLGGPVVGKAHIGRIASCWGDLQHDSVSLLKDIAFGSITNEMSVSEGFDRHYTIAVLLVVFFLLSAVFQFMFLNSGYHKDNIIANKPQWFRYTEYSLSASCMVIAIFISFGMLDSYLHFTVFVLTFLCMVIGLAADYIRFLSTGTGGNAELQKTLRGISLGLHYMAWIPISVVWCILWIVVLDMAIGREVCHNPNGSELPWWVWVVLIGQFILFNSFGYVQRVQFSNQFDIDYVKVVNWRLQYNEKFLDLNHTYVAATTGLETESAFIVLSLVAKSLLGWTIYSQVLIFL